ncbi:hypothetical protein [Enterobacter roggenkampii]|uniref:hypothetical protein n=1 Tax=Enterobacter roggenkampii TaxID=1812935 RepID=UPI003F74AAE3
MREILISESAWEEMTCLFAPSLDKLGDTISKGIFNSGTANTLIVFGLAFLLGLSLGALALRHISNHLQYLKEILELAKKEKEQQEK